MAFGTAGCRGVADVFIEIDELRCAFPSLPIALDEEMDGQLREFEAAVGIAHAAGNAKNRIRRDEVAGGVGRSGAAGRNVENREGIERIVVLLLDEAANKEAGLQPLAVSKFGRGGVIAAGDNVGARNGGEIIASGNIGL